MSSLETQVQVNYQQLDGGSVGLRLGCFSKRCTLLPKVAVQVKASVFFVLVYEQFLDGGALSMEQEVIKRRASVFLTRIPKGWRHKSIREQLTVLREMENPICPQSEDDV